jgi:hypothetical protein
MWDLFINVLLPLWVIIGMFGLVASIMYLCIKVSDYRSERDDRYPSKKILAHRANEVYKAVWLVVAVIFLPIAIIPAALYFPAKWVKASYYFFKQLNADRRGVDALN